MDSDKGDMFYKQVGIEFMYTPIDKMCYFVYFWVSIICFCSPKGSSNVYKKKAKHTDS